MKDLIQEMNQFLQMEGSLFDRSTSDLDQTMEIINNETDPAEESFSFFQD